MNLAFTKMQGLGNDFVVIDATAQPLSLSTAQLQRLADRRFGVGCDQILLVEPPRLADTAFHYRIFNADGGEVEQCGNGARCFARFVRDRGLTQAEVIPVGTARGRIVLYAEADGQIRVDMGPPRFAPAEVPFIADAEATRYPLALDDETAVEGAVLSMGNPHLVLTVADVDSAPVQTLGPRLERHPRFPQGVNVGFMQVLARDAFRLRVWERGVGETLACGTGACAALVAGRRLALLDATAQARLPGGNLVLSWRGAGDPVWMTGPAEPVFEGRIQL